MSDRKPLAEMTVDAVLSQWPETAAVFLQQNMLCVGCQLTTFCTVIDAAADHHLPHDQLLESLKRAILTQDQ